MGHDRRGRLFSITQNGVKTLAYNDASQVLSETYSGGVLGGLTVTRGYDEFLRRTNLETRVSSLLTQHGYGYDAASRLSTVTDGASTMIYTYVTNSPLVGQVDFRHSGVTRITPGGNTIT